MWNSPIFLLDYVRLLLGCPSNRRPRQSLLSRVPDTYRESADLLVNHWHTKPVIGRDWKN